MVYRTRTYIAGEWDGDSNLIETLQRWNESEKWSLSFSDAHNMKQARDTSYPCNIKRSLADRLNGSKTFVLVVGDKTKTATKGSCQFCSHYSSYWGKCLASGTPSFKSFITYECEKAVRDGLRIIVLYNSTIVQKSKCPEAVKDRGKHIAAIYKGTDGKYYWNYTEIKKAIQG